MTETAARLGRLARPHARARVLAVALAAAGLGLAFAAGAVALAPRLAAILGGWLALLAVAAGAAWAVRRVRRAAAAQAVGRLVETAAGSRAGSILGLVAPPAGAAGVSAGLFAAADARAADAVARAAPAVRRFLAQGTRRGLAAGLGVAAAGAALFVAVSPRAGVGREGAAAFWHPLRALREARSPVRLTVDRTTVRRGEGVVVAIEAPGGIRATLWTRGPGEPWRPTVLDLDPGGRATRRLGPLASDLHLRASSGGRSSPELRVSVALPAFLAELALTARYPGYLDRPDEPLVPGPDTLLVPAGTEIRTAGLASVPLGRAAWRRGEATVCLRVAGDRFEGRFVPRASGTWRLRLATADSSPIEGALPELHLRLVRDSAPVVNVPVPGRDTTLPLSLRQPLVIDARDDHGLTHLAVVSWRVSRTGKLGEAVREPLDASGVGDRAILQAELALEQRGLLPGDTLRFRVEAWDNAPTPQLGRSAEFALRLPSLEELRAATRAAGRDVAVAAESLAGAQAELGDRTRDLAQERARGDPQSPGGRQPPGQAGTLPFPATERAEEVVRQQAAVAERVAELARAVAEIARAARAAGLDDTAFQARLAEVQALLERALTPELEQRIRELQEALARLDPEAARQALQRLAEAQQQLRRELERSQEMFRRAAVEGALASLAADAEDLERRQREWNREDAPRADTAAAALEGALADRADSLLRGIEQAAWDLAREQAGLEQSRDAARRAGQAMRRAAAEAERGAARAAGRSGEAAADELAELPEALRAQRDSLAREWRDETLAALDRALAETAALAARQQQVAESLRHGAGGPGGGGGRRADPGRAGGGGAGHGGDRAADPGSGGEARAGLAPARAGAGLRATPDARGARAARAGRARRLRRGDVGRRGARRAQRDRLRPGAQSQRGGGCEVGLRVRGGGGAARTPGPGAAGAHRRGAGPHADARTGRSGDRGAAARPGGPAARARGAARPAPGGRGSLGCGGAGRRGARARAPARGRPPRPPHHRAPGAAVPAAARRRPDVERSEAGRAEGAHQPLGHGGQPASAGAPGAGRHRARPPPAVSHLGRPARTHPGSTPPGARVLPPPQ